MNRLLAILAFGWGFLAFAQGSGTIPTDLGAWFASTASLAAVVAAFVALVRKHIWKSLEGVGVLALSFVLSVGLAFVGNKLGYLGADWLSFGLGAFLLASGGTSYIRSLGNAAGDTRTDADRARLR